MDYHQRLRKLKMYSLERRRERYLIIYGWQQIEGIKENVLKLHTNIRDTSRRINLSSISNKGTDGERILPSLKT